MVSFNLPLSYTTFDKLRKVERASVGETEFAYDADRMRVVQRRSVDGTEVRTHYIGSVEFDYVDRSDTPNEVRRSTAGMVLVTTDENDNRSARYQHRDYLGSVVMISDFSGEILARMSYDAWGNRQAPYWETGVFTWLQWDTFLPGWVSDAGNLPGYTPRGFTGHEHLDHFGIIHMNGRIYDSVLARFMQADSMMEDAVTLNRYTYVHNNPFAYTDPSGHLSFKEFARIAASVAISVYTGGSASGAAWGLFGGSVSTGTALTTVAIGGALSNAVATGSWEGAAWGAFSAQLFFGAGQWIGSSDWAQGSFAGGLSGAGFAAKTISHGLIGGTVSHLQGGQFGHGFVSSAAGAAATPSVSGHFGGNRLAQGAVIALVGGSASSLTGGKFANGAVTAAMGYSFNQVISEVQRAQHAKFRLELAAAFSGNYASGGSRALFKTSAAAAELWADMALAITTRYDRWGFEAGAALLQVGDHWTWSAPVAGSARGYEVNLSPQGIGVSGHVPRIHTQPSGSFSGQYVYVIAGTKQIASRRGVPNGDLANAWNRGGSSFVAVPSGQIDYFNYTKAYDASGHRFLKDYVETIRKAR